MRAAAIARPIGGRPAPRGRLIQGIADLKRAAERVLTGQYGPASVHAAAVLTWIDRAYGRFLLAGR